MDASSTFLPLELLLLAVIALIVFAPSWPPSLWRQLRDQLDQLGRELDVRLDRGRWRRRQPIFSAETTRGKEAQLIRERLPRKAPRARFVVLLFLIGVFLWLFARQFG
ncbi:MAG TPA: hypothetical protein VF405_04000 [Gammaproteobacteria bacterium]